VLSSVLRVLRLMLARGASTSRRATAHSVSTITPGCAADGACGARGLACRADAASAGSLSQPPRRPLVRLRQRCYQQCYRSCIAHLITAVKEPWRSFGARLGDASARGAIPCRCCCHLDRPISPRVRAGRSGNRTHVVLCGVRPEARANYVAYAFLPSMREDACARQAGSHTSWHAGLPTAASPLTIECFRHQVRPDGERLTPWLWREHSGQDGSYGKKTLVWWACGARGAP
jgi:hypothetical protein